MIMSFRLRRTLKTYDIEASVNSRLLAGIVDVNIPTYQLALPSRGHSEYWSHKNTGGSRHGASWQNFNWQRRRIDEKMIQVHFSDQIKLPEASIDFADLIRYLGDLGLQTNPESFWELSQKGLNVRPGTCLMREIGEDNLEKPILVVAKPTSEHPGTLLLRFQNKPGKTPRTERDLDPDWIRVPAIPKTTVPAESKEVNGSEKLRPLDSDATNETAELTKDKTDEAKPEKVEEEIIENVRISRKGFLEKKLVGGITLPVVGLPYWFVYAMLASTSLNGHHDYNGRPFGYRIRLETLFFSREVSIGMASEDTFSEWTTFISQLLDDAKVKAIPQEWTDDPPARKDARLMKRFELMVDSKLRNRAAELRRPRQRSFQAVAEIRVNSRQKIYNPHFWADKVDNIYIPFEVLSVPTAIWSEAAGHCVGHIHPLPADRVPTSQEICVAAMSNMDFAWRVGDTLKEFYKWFEGEGEYPVLRVSHFHNQDRIHQVILMCAIIIIQSIADGAPYLAALGDVEKCVTKWDPVYLC
ncbi:uncharacterized protein K444DRAFT_616140 [Hyaloscypha bicolor E]|uniref:Uncharacterized protein n=1 Tax=Hyaloscypha bicolor E TaxID=1095630 RepID=A0A2J6SZY2_9HELO|nr:uncharacterized protein K444DRAFT_616140 [Hyaloscypha bicolor E]PMD56327.1 hypothetical protein K444DRAFT_616140 [Hyaloscypha bicolor E]